MTEDMVRFLEQLKLCVAQQEALNMDTSSEPRDITYSPTAPGVVSGTLEYSNGDVYQGEYLDNKRHGVGEHKSSNGDTYSGGWNLDKRHGKGVFTCKEGPVVRYDGEWSNDQTNGYGVCLYRTGARYEGEYKSDKREGWGALVLPEGDRYEGEWRDDVIHGNGVWQYVDGSYFEGQHEGGQRRSGKFVSGDRKMEYSGGFQDTLFHGEGTLIWEGHYKYRGQWKKGKRDGQGECWYLEGAHYQGMWRDDMRWGQGRLSMAASGYCYDGSWEKDKQHGQGTCQLASGDKYEGNWRDGLRHGTGRCIYATGNRYQGEWSQDKREGQGACIYHNGDKYQGGWKDDKRHGIGVCLFADGTRFHGRWEEDEWLQCPADPTCSTISGPGLARAWPGEKTTLKIQAKDHEGNPRLSGGDAFSLVLVGPGGLEVCGEVEDHQDGTYSASYCVVRAGRYQLNVYLEDEDVPSGDEEPSGSESSSRKMACDSPYPVLVMPGNPYPGKCRVRGKRSVLQGQTCEAEVVLADKHGNPCMGKVVAGATVEVVLTTPQGEELPTTCRLAEWHAELQLPGTDHIIPLGYRAMLMVVEYIPVSSGYHRLEILVGGRHISGSPISLRVDPLVALPGPSREDLDSPHKGSHEGSKEGERVVDLSQYWTQVAYRQYVEDGNEEGWGDEEEGGGDRDGGAPGGSSGRNLAEEQHVKRNPEVPVVERLEDLWKVGQLQRACQEQKRRESAVEGLKKELGLTEAAGEAEGAVKSEPQGLQ